MCLAWGGGKVRLEWGRVVLGEKWKTDGGSLEVSERRNTLRNSSSHGTHWKHQIQYGPGTWPERCPHTDTADTAVWPSWQSGADSAWLVFPARTRPAWGINWPFGTTGSPIQQGLGSSRGSSFPMQVLLPSFPIKLLGGRGRGKASLFCEVHRLSWGAGLLGFSRSLLCVPGLLFSSWRWTWSAWGLPPPLGHSSCPASEPQESRSQCSRGGAGKAAPERHRKGQSPTLSLIPEAPGCRCPLP